MKSPPADTFFPVGGLLAVCEIPSANCFCRSCRMEISDNLRQHHDSSSIAATFIIVPDILFFSFLRRTTLNEPHTRITTKGDIRYDSHFISAAKESPGVGSDGRIWIHQNNITRDIHNVKYIAIIIPGNAANHQFQALRSHF